MAPEPSRTTRLCLRITTTALLCAAPAHALRVVNYNILNYPSLSSTGALNANTRNPHFRTIFAPLAADVVVVQEMQSQAGVDLFLSGVLNTNEPGQWASAPFQDGGDTDNALFYKPARVQLVSTRHFYVSSDLTRLVAEYRLRPVDYASAASEFRLLSLHLKSSTGSTNVAQRLREATGLRDTMNAYPPGTHAIVAGDFNIYSGAEAAFVKFLESQADDDGRLYDPLGAPAITWNTASLSAIHTQSPCNTCPGGWATGGLDDRFDMFLPTYAWNDGNGYELLVPTYKPVGNDGQHYNLNMTDAPTIPEGAGYAAALVNAADHLPIRVDLRLPARGTVTPALAFGTVITGAPAPSRDLTVSNANAPLDELDDLDYTLTAPIGFTLAGGPHSALEGVANVHAVSMLTTTPGLNSGDVFTLSDDADQPARATAVTGTVLRHAEMSLDSLLATDAATLDFGSALPGEHPTLTFRVHDRGFDALQAQLQLTSAVITGGAGRFALSPVFVAETIGAVGRTYGVTFDGLGAATDSLYEATLAVAGADEPLPGGSPVAGVSLLLRATVEAGGTVGAGTLAPPVVTMLFSPAPNPLRDASTIRFDLSRDEQVSIDVHDVSGRRIARLIDARLTPGRYSVRWTGRDTAGQPASAGLYFVRMTTDGDEGSTARLAIVR